MRDEPLGRSLQSRNIKQTDIFMTVKRSDSLYHAIYRALLVLLTYYCSGNTQFCMDTLELKVEHGQLFKFNLIFKSIIVKWDIRYN